MCTAMNKRATPTTPTTLDDATSLNQATSACVVRAPALLCVLCHSDTAASSRMLYLAQCHQHSSALFLVMHPAYDWTQYRRSQKLELGGADRGPKGQKSRSNAENRVGFLPPPSAKGLGSTESPPPSGVLCGAPAACSFWAWKCRRENA